jgi:oxygen-independent coproporphyrinogen III oxidase
LRLREEMMNSMEKELSLSAIGYETIETIYFGGGTPSLLSSDDIKRLLDVVYQRCKVAKNVEITLESNPDDINESKLNEWKETGINRLSIGVQSFHEEDLKWMNRAHNAEQALKSIQLAKESGFINYSVDLIFGTPTLTDENWKKNIEQLIELDVPHISSYALTVEPKTALAKMIDLKKKENIDTDKQARQFVILMESLETAGYEHYEISNFAKPGLRSKHNSSYWKGIPYVGIGPSAHSYDGKSRKWNISNNALYIQSIEKGIIPYEEEILTPTQMLNEFIMISLRTIEGLDLNKVNDGFGVNESNRLIQQAGKYIDEGKIIHDAQQLKLTREGKLFADGIAAELFKV